MTPADIAHDADRNTLKRILFDNLPPFTSLEQCDLVINVGNRLRFTDPEEMDSAGDRLRMRDIMPLIEEANRARVRFLVMSEKATVIVPPDDLR